MILARSTVVAALAVMLAVASCSGDGGDSSSPPQAPESASSTRTPDETVAAVPAVPVVGLEELCSDDLTIAGIDLTAVTRLPTEDGETLGEAGARSLLDEMIDPDVTFCGLETSAQTRALIDAADEAFATGDTDEAARILESILDVVDQAWIPWSGEGIHAAEGTSTEQQVRDLYEAAAAAYRQGNEDLGDEIAEQAKTAAIDVATTRMQETNEPAVLLTVAAQAALVGESEFANTAIEKAASIVTEELEVLTNGNPELGTPPYDPCTASQEEAGEYANAAARVILLDGDGGDPATEAVERIQTTWERMHDYQTVAQECGNLTFTAIDEVPGWDGLIELYMATCDASTWEGFMTIDVSFNAGGGTGRQTGVADTKVELALGQAQATGDIEMDRTITFEAGGQSAVVSNPQSGTITFGVDARNATAKAVVDFPASTETVSAGGMSFSMPVQGMKSEFTGTISHDNDCE